MYRNCNAWEIKYPIECCMYQKFRAVLLVQFNQFEEQILAKKQFQADNLTGKRISRTKVVFMTERQMSVIITTINQRCQMKSATLVKMVTFSNLKINSQNMYFLANFLAKTVAKHEKNYFSYYHPLLCGRLGSNSEHTFFFQYLQYQYKIWKLFFLKRIQMLTNFNDKYYCFPSNIRYKKQNFLVKQK